MSSSNPLSPRTRHARQLFGGIARQYDRMGYLLSFGQDRRWRRFLVERPGVRSGGRVLDVATGTAGVAMALAGRNGARVVGLDQSEPMLRVGEASLRAAGLEDGVTLVVGQAEHLPFPDSAFDAVTFTYLLRYVDDPAATLEELVRVLRPGGTLAGLEFRVPNAPQWRAAWRLYTRLGLPALGALSSRAWYRTGRFLGPSIEAFYRRYPLAEQGAMWRAAGIEPVFVRTMSLGGGIVTWGARAR
jgi:demethylmenaquinone methyltransferase / 2-methoxy-6-polyprenyl-1,4-benzoquinol methylase